MQPVPVSSRPLFLAVFLAFALVAILTLFSVSEDLRKSLTGGRHTLCDESVYSGIMQADQSLIGSWFLNRPLVVSEEQLCSGSHNISDSPNMYPHALDLAAVGTALTSGGNRRPAVT